MILLIIVIDLCAHGERCCVWRALGTDGMLRMCVERSSCGDNEMRAAVRERVCRCARGLHLLHGAAKRERERGKERWIEARMN